MKWRDKRNILIISTDYDGTLVEILLKRETKL